ncbi:MAG: sensor histidine kinase [Acidobacteriota bacterium]
MSKASRIWLLVTAVLVGSQIVAAALLPRGCALTLISDISLALLLFSAILAMVPNALASKGRVRVFWWLMVAGIGSWFLYQLSWNYFELYRHQEVPELFVGDIVLFLHLVPMIAALAMQPHQQHDNRDVRLGSLDFALLFAWWIYLYLFTVIPWQYALPDLANYEHNLNAIYLTEKVVFLGGLCILWVRSSSGWRTIYAHLFCASLLYALTSYSANWAIARKLYYTGSLYDVPLSISMGWFTAIALLGRSPHKQEQTEQRSTHGVWVARLGMVTTFSLPLFAVWMLFDHSAPAAVKEFRMLLTLATMMLMGIMVFLKQHLLDAELLSLLRSSQESFENLKRLQAQLVQSEKLASLGQLVGGAAHELNNPLAAMLGYTDLLAASNLDPEQRQLTDKIGQQVRRTRVLVASLLSFAKQVPGKKAPLDLTALVQTVTKLSQPQLRTRRIELHTELASNLPPILGDSNQLLQVCLHIISNSVHALEEKPSAELSVFTRLEGTDVILEFCDNGPGAVEPERVFDPFYTTRPVGQGTGLGLSACYGIVQEHHGRIVCRNRPQGGASFRIELPAISAAGDRASTADGRAKAAAVAKSLTAN